MLFCGLIVACDPGQTVDPIATGGTPPTGGTGGTGGATITGTGGTGGAVTTEAPTPSVLIDDFEDDLGDAPNETFVCSHVRGRDGGPSFWFAHSDPKTVMLGLDDEPLPVIVDNLGGNTVWDATEAVGEYGWEGAGIRIAADAVSWWAGMAAALGIWDKDFVDLTGLTAVSFRAKGPGGMRMQFHAKVGDEYFYPGKDLVLTSEFERYIVSAADIDNAGEEGMNWDTLMNRVTMIDFIVTASNVPTEVYLDAIRLYGVDYSAFKCSAQ
jgi:hypothetical protein